jgi:hypothetical protein
MGAPYPAYILLGKETPLGRLGLQQTRPNTHKKKEEKNKNKG